METLCLLWRVGQKLKVYVSDWSIVTCCGQCCFVVNVFRCACFVLCVPPQAVCCFGLVNGDNCVHVVYVYQLKFCLSSLEQEYSQAVARQRHHEGRANDVA